MIAVIDTETNWYDQIMSIGVIVADDTTFTEVDRRYYVIDPEYRVGGVFAGVLFWNGVMSPVIDDRANVLNNLNAFIRNYGIESIYAYNAKFDMGHLPELSTYDWFDIMRIAAYKQYNPMITDEVECCKTGRIKRGYGVEGILRMLESPHYCETHNALQDAVDELRIMELLGVNISEYQEGYCR